MVVNVLVLNWSKYRLAEWFHRIEDWKCRFRERNERRIPEDILMFAHWQPDLWGWSFQRKKNGITSSLSRHFATFLYKFIADGVNSLEFQTPSPTRFPIFTPTRMLEASVKGMNASKSFFAVWAAPKISGSVFLIIAQTTTQNFKQHQVNSLDSFDIRSFCPLQKPPVKKKKKKKDWFLLCAGSIS